MDWISIHDFITPTNSLVAMFFGILITAIVTIIIWFETKEIKTAFLLFLFGSGTVILLVFILNSYGFYK